ncbi:ABC transporter ATP-binding protein [Schinkia azotoformans]|uniref:ABC transporter ATP-binding protein n=1 Tax=Schinkia azotoformans TaxID=1454 RepID=UPI002DBAD9AC|nr:ABC transporter ATP-binding protein [Schinkia azotoformans]MEC1717692.1 ABC transporter ATP-binding protein [Schinkia azotoformans]MEC1747805.1 ABC transporter ATP-binding protein [Schinkia azotoformans]MEC1760449.1 ABC transporter ATP-binding protein [Schinkia azotoformans]MEC1771565.1 ABC transporter ATP-binding protein [Schinkia azotoformans]MEC1779681.1 ABC transporter ATP-binding protein [Schinkia azotoformans]
MVKKEKVELKSKKVARSHKRPNSSENGQGLKSFKQLFVYSRAFVPAIIIAMVLAMAGAIFNIIGPDLLGDMTDTITEGMMTSIDMEAIVDVATILLILYGLMFVFQYAQGFIMATVTQRISKNLRKDLSKKMNRLPLKYFDSTSTGDVLSRVTNDVDLVGQTLNQSLSGLTSAVTLFLGSLVMMFYTNWIMAISAVLSTFIGFALMTFVISKSQVYFGRQQQQLGKLNGYIEEIYSGQSVVKAYNGEKMARETFHEINTGLYDSAWKSQFLSGLMMPFMMFVGNLGYVVVCIVGAALAVNDYISFGVIVSFMLYIRLFTQPLSQIAQGATQLQSTAAASARVFEFLEEKELADEREKTKRLETVSGDVEFRNVRFGYNENQPVIKNFSVKVKAGQKVAIVGPTGAGKTTLVNLLMRFYEVNDGEILIDGVPTSQLTRENLHELFCMVLQDTWLFEGTIRDNIVYSSKGVTDEQLESACKAVGLYHYIKTLPKGYDTILDDKASLSAGQKQLITIARAMVKTAPLLILDEATSSVDTRTEMLIQQAMDKLTEGKTSFVIAHRLSTIKNADVILVMKDGDIIETGNHEELLLKNGFYAELYNSQFEEVS